MTEQTENTAANAEDVEKNTEDINQENAAETAENEAPAQEAQDVSKDPEALTIVIQDLNKKLKEADLRTAAEVDNMRKRKDKEIDDAKKYAISKFAGDLLPVIDALEKALSTINPEDEAFKNIHEGINLTLKSMMATITKYGMEQLDPVDQPFDPNTQHAVQMIDAPEGKKPNTVLHVIQKGYNLNGRNIRPAMVIVAKPEPLDEKV
ncbi:MAG: nucleotide exchange factor GrpE [Succinivibrionaceae bacterium]|nr:nucleotide exchange factor GrpE [Succinivibrionaceae bacterium]